MKRKIKFRMWNYINSNPEKSNMLYDTWQVMECLRQQIQFDEGHILGYDYLSTGRRFMQFTNLYDRKGNEIYEGDILQDCFNETYVVKWNNGTWADSTHVEDNAGTVQDLFNYRARLKKVIGNIYENPELLKQ